MMMVMVVYNEALDMEIMELLERCGIKAYTKVTGTFGKGAASGSHLGTDIWPGRNNILYAACDNAEGLLAGISELRKELATEGIKAFTWGLEEVV